MTARLDAIDHKILDIVQHEGRISNVDLAARIQLSAPQAFRRVRSLEERGVIRGYRADVAPEAIGFAVTAYVSVSIGGDDFGRVREIEAEIRAFPQILECYSVSGEDDYLLKVVAHDLKSLSNFLTDRLMQVPGIDDVRSMICLEEIKLASPLPVAPEREAWSMRTRSRAREEDAQVEELRKSPRGTSSISTVRGRRCRSSCPTTSARASRPSITGSSASCRSCSDIVGKPLVGSAGFSTWPASRATTRSNSPRHGSEVVGIEGRAGERRQVRLRPRRDRPRASRASIRTTCAISRSPSTASSTSSSAPACSITCRRPMLGP